MNNEGELILSILIPSIPERKDKLERLLLLLNRQIETISEHPMLGNVEVVVNNSKSFLDEGVTVGEKRNQLIEQAQGKYVCFLDDDESIAPNYVETLLRLCNEDKDVCTFRAVIKLTDYWGLVDMKLAYKNNDQSSPEYTIRRTAWHICPVRREFATMYQFENKNNAEDFAWFEKVLTNCVSDAHTERILFQYNHGEWSEVDKIENHG